MKFTTITLLALATAVMAAPENANELRQRLHNTAEKRDAEPEAFDLEPRACTPSKCSCIYIPAGLFCGDGLLGCKKGYVYQCSGGPKSCVYGPRKSCQQCGKLQC